jgi:hypothetical protein
MSEQVNKEPLWRKYFYLWILIGCSITLFTILEINEQMKLADQKSKSEIRYVMQLYSCGIGADSMCQGTNTYRLSENNLTFAGQKAKELEGHGNYEIQIETLEGRMCCGEWHIMTGGYGFGGEKLN